MSTFENMKGELKMYPKEETHMGPLAPVELAGTSGVECSKDNDVEVKPDLKDDFVKIMTEEDSNQNEEDSDFDIKEEVDSEGSDSEESNFCKEETEENFDQNEEEDIQENIADYQKILVQNYSSATSHEEPIENIKDVFKKTHLEFEKEIYHQQLFEEIVENSGKISVKDLQAQYLDKLRQAANIEIFTCSLCNYQTINMTNLKCHLLIHHNGKIESEIFKCNKCDYESNFESYMTRHLATHHRRLTTKSTSKEKYKEKQRKEKFPCPECSYKGRSEEGLKHHMSMHKDRTKCDLCLFQSKNKNQLKNHKESHKEGQKYKCYKCDYKNNVKLTLARHLLNVHEIVNEASKRSKICEICSHSFSNIHQLRRHYVTHKNISEMGEEEIFKCNICNHQTKYKSNFKLHMLVHKAPDLICEVCGFATRRKKNYDEHLITHKKLDEIEWFRCDLCPYQSRIKKLLRRHIKRGDHSGKRLVHVRNRDRIREAEEKGEDINVLIRKYRIKKINGVEIKRERLRKPRDPNKKRVRKSKRKPKLENPDLEEQNDHLIRLNDLLPSTLPQIF